MPFGGQCGLWFSEKHNVLYVGGGVPDAPDEVYFTTQGGVKTPPYKPRQTAANDQTVNHAHLRGVEDAAPYVREATWI